MSLPGPHFAHEDYNLLPEDRRYEIVERELLVTPAPSARHQGILVRGINRCRISGEHYRGLLISHGRSAAHPTLRWRCRPSR